MNDRVALYLSSGILFLLIVACGLFLALRDREKAAMTQHNKTVPEFSRPEFSSADLTGNVSMVHFFNSQCTACETEHPLLMALKDRYGYSIFGINVRDTNNGRVDYLHRLGNPYAAITEDADGTLAELWRAEILPSSYIIDNKGNIVVQNTGPISAEQFDAKILKVMRALQN